MKLFSVLLMLSSHAFAVPWVSEACGYSIDERGEVFTLQIQRSFDPEVVFTQCEKNTGKYLATTTTQVGATREPPQTTKTTNRTFRSLSKAEFEKVTELFNGALDFDARDQTRGEDGSRWCLEAEHGSYVKACFWSPGSRAQERGLSGLFELGRHLWTLTGLEDDPAGGRLY